LEIATALGRDIRVIPVLVQGALMSRANHLPEDLRGLAHRNALAVSDNRFRTDVDQLICALEAPTSDSLVGTVFVEAVLHSGGVWAGSGRWLILG
jgi:hypothetical protein